MRQNIYALVRKTISHELVAGSLFIFIGSMANNIFSFLFNLFLVRKFATSDYGTYISLISLVTLITFFAQSFSAIFVKFAASFFAEEKIDHAAAFYKRIIFLMFFISGVIFIFLLVFSSLIGNFLHFENTNYVLISGIIIIFTYLSIANEAFLRSSLKFKYLSFLSFLGSLIKLISGGVLVILGYKIFGALIGVLLNSTVLFLLGGFPFLYLLKKRKSVINFSMKPIFKYAIPASLTILASTSFISTDIIMVKHFFSPHTAGLYGGLSLIGKVIFYFTYPIPIVMFPLIIKRHTRGIAFHSLFYLSLLMVLVSGFLITLFYFIFPDLTVNVFLGKKDYTSIAPYLGVFGVYLTVYSLINVCISFFLSIGKTSIYKFVLPFAFLQASLILIFHNNFQEIIVVSMLSCGLLLVALLLYYYREFYGIYHAKKSKK